VDEERLAAARFFPLRRDDARPTAPPAFAGARA